MVLTSNKAFGEWGQIFGGDMVMASAILDRLLHRATVLNIRGDSYRLREKRLASAAAAGSTLASASVVPLSLEGLSLAATGANGGVKPQS